MAKDLISRLAEELLAVQRAISRKKNAARVGERLRVLVEGPSEESELVMAGRHAGQAPDIDGVVYLSGEPVLPGELVKVRVTKASDYDLVADVLEKLPLPKIRTKAAPALVHHSSDGRRTLRTLP